MSTITSHKLSLTCIRIHLKKCYVLLILLMMCSSLPMLGEEQYKWMKTTPLTSIWHRPTAYCCATTR